MRLSRDKIAKSYGFIDASSKSFKVFEAVPIYPEVTNTKMLAKKLKISTTDLKTLMSRMPANVPIFEDFGEIGRYE